MAKNTQQLVAQTNCWRDAYNPLRSLTIARAISLLEAGQRGEYADLQWTYEFIEQTDPDLLTLVERRTAALCELPDNYKQVAEDVEGYDKSLAEDQVAKLRAAYRRIDNLYEAIEHFEMAAFRGFAHVQPHLHDNGDIAHLEPLDQWNFARDGRKGDWVWNPEAKSVGAKSLPGEDNIANFNPALMIYEVRRPIDRIGLIKFVRMNLSEKDWDAYVEIYGIPSWIIVGPENVPDDKEAEYRDAAEDVAAGGSGYLPHGSDAKAADTPRGSQPFEVRLEWLTKKLVLAGTGGLLTMLTQSGSGTLAGGAHMEVFKQIARSRANKISAFMRRTADRYILERAFPGRPVLAYFDLAEEQEQDSGEVVTQVKDLSQYFILDPSDVQERTGYKILGHRQQAQQIAGTTELISEGDETTPPAAANRARARNRDNSAAGELLARARIQLAEAQSEALLPVAERLNAIYNQADTDDADPDELRVALERFRDVELPELLQSINAEPETAQVLEDLMSAALLNGYAEGAGQRLVASDLRADQNGEQA